MINKFNKNNNNIIINNNTDKKLISKLNEENKYLSKKLNQERIKVEELLVKKDNPIAINFTSIDQNILFPVVCYSSDKFIIVEEKLYHEYPELKNKKIFFTVNGGVLDRNATLDENKIKNGNNILINNFVQDD